MHGLQTLPVVNSVQSLHSTDAEDCNKGGPPCFVSSVAINSDMQVNYTGLLCELATLTLDQLGSYPSFQHQIELKPDAISIICHV